RNVLRFNISTVTTECGRSPAVVNRSYARSPKARLYVAGRRSFDRVSATMPAMGSGEWFADESIWKDLYPFTFPESAFAMADEQVEKILRLTGVVGGAVLDLCCGPGRHTVALARRGFAVTAVDRTTFLLDQARARTQHANLAVEFVLEDMRRFSRPASFDLIINFFTSFGYFDDPTDDLRVLELVRENLKPGGVFVLEMVSKERLARAFQATTSRE